MPSTPRLFALNIVDDPKGGSVVGVIAKRTYSVKANGCSVADEHVALVEGPLPSDDGAILLHDFDTALNRTLTDVIVVGKARPPAKARAFDIRVRVGTLDRSLRVFGDRRCWRDALGHLRFSEPQPVEEVDGGWSSAYGGVDEVARAKHGDPIEQHCKDVKKPYNSRFGLFAYPRNRAGKGYLIDATTEGLEACALPNLEVPTHLLTPEGLAVGRADWWPSGPPVAGLGWLSYGYFPRCAMVGLLPHFEFKRFPPETFFEVQTGALNSRSIAERMALPERMDVAVAQQSALGMRVPVLDPGAQVKLDQLHPREASWSFSLSSEVPTMVLEMPDISPVELSPQIRTVLLEPEKDRVCVTWVGEHREAIPVGPNRRAKIRSNVRWGA
jgi:hypothetical protein